MARNHGIKIFNEVIFENSKAYSLIHGRSQSLTRPITVNYQAQIPPKAPLRPFSSHLKLSKPTVSENLIPPPLPTRDFSRSAVVEKRSGGGDLVKTVDQMFVTRPILEEKPGTPRRRSASCDPQVPIRNEVKAEPRPPNASDGDKPSGSSPPKCPDGAEKGQGSPCSPCSPCDHSKPSPSKGGKDTPKDKPPCKICSDEDTPVLPVRFEPVRIARSPKVAAMMPQDANLEGLDYLLNQMKKINGDLKRSHGETKLNIREAMQLVKDIRGRINAAYRFTVAAPEAMVAPPKRIAKVELKPPKMVEKRKVKGKDGEKKSPVELKGKNSPKYGKKQKPAKPKDPLCSVPSTIRPKCDIGSSAAQKLRPKSKTTRRPF